MTPTDIPTPVSAPAEAQVASDDATSDHLTPDDATSSGTTSDEGRSAPVTTDVELEAARDRWLRAEADLQNYRRRAHRDVEEARRGAEDRALLDLIECLDDLDRALTAARDAGAAAAWVQGVELVAQRMRETLARAGVTPVTPRGEAFDPRHHEALMELPAPEGTEPGTVLHVERSGYRRGDRVLRAARVTVAAAPAEGA